MFYDVLSDYNQGTPLESEPVIVYGTTWCGMTQVVRRYLDRAAIPYQYVDLEMNPRAKTQLRWLTGGYTNHPTVYIDGQVLIEPSLSELQVTLARKGYVG
jgi:mycoredoxin